MLKTYETAALVTSLPEGAYLLESGANAACLFTGVRTTIIDGMAHLVFCTTQPSSDGSVEYMIVARLVAPELRAAACLTHAAMEIAKGPTAIDGRPAN